jgi:hypothetical protein
MKVADRVTETGCCCYRTGVGVRGGYDRVRGYRGRDLRGL